MLIKSTLAYKSVTPLEVDNLPNFVIISGLNGSGKTHLLEGIYVGGGISILENNLPLSPVKLVDHNTLSPTNGTIVSVQNLNDQVQQAWNNYKPYLDRKKENPSVNFNSFLSDDFRQFLTVIADSASKNVENLRMEDFYKYYPTYPMKDGLNNVDIFQQNFSFLFKRYQVRKLDNKFDKFLAQELPKDNIEFLEDDEFVRLYGEPPWELVNKILKEANLDYQINTPQFLWRDTPYELRLVNKFNNAEVFFSDLSSGEKVLMSLALALYNSKFDAEFPKVLLMDEPDAHLHPSMTKSFLQVIEKVFVLEKKVKVIITTHSPSTVALAPKEALYIMNKASPRIEKVSKDKALSILTSGVPTLSIGYENRRQVFVESRYDVFFYEKIYEKLKEKLIPEISINFIASGGIKGEGNCQEVKEIVNKMVSYGNKTVYGIIDWDLKNNGNDFVKVLGRDKRYSIENYIFDPIFLAAFLVREKFIDKTKLGLNDKERYTDFDNFEETRLQTIADYIIQEIAAKGSDKTEITLKEIHYINAKKIKVPHWFLKHQGHQLEEIIKEIFPQLKKFQGEALKKEIINKIIDDIPAFIAQELLELLSGIQNYGK